MVVAFAGEAVYGVNDNSMDASFVLTAVGEQFLEFRSVGRFCRLALLDENPIHLVTMTIAVFLACLFLDRQAQVLNLILGRYTAVDNRLHRPQWFRSS